MPPQRFAAILLQTGESASGSNALRLRLQTQEPAQAIASRLLATLAAERAEILCKAITPDLNDPFNVTLLTDSDIDGDEARLEEALTALSMIGGRRLVRVRLGSEKASIDKMLAAALKAMGYQTEVRAGVVYFAGISASGAYQNGKLTYSGNLNVTKVKQSYAAEIIKQTYSDPEWDLAWSVDADGNPTVEATCQSSW